MTISKILSRKMLRARRGMARIGDMGEDLGSSVMGIDKRTV